MKDYYQILGVSKDASDEEIKKAFKRAAIKYHPDRHPDDPEKYAAKFKEVNEAYDVLSHPEKRQMYDQGIDPNQQGAGGGFQGGFGGGDFGDIFGDIFGRRGGGRGAQQEPERGADLQMDCTVTLEDVYSGCTKDISVQTLVECPDCHGTGAASGTEPETCPYCHGSGQITMRQGFFQVRQPCPHCHGTGKYVKTPCPHCHGSGTVKKRKTLSVRIPAGADSGMVLRLSGEGQAAPRGGVPGDLYVRIIVEPHRIFTREDSTLYCEVPISFVTAALGGSVTVPTLDGEKSITISGETQTGKRFRIRGGGMPTTSGGKGDLIVAVKVETPVKLNDEQKELLRKFGESLGESQDKPGSHSPEAKDFVDRIKQFFKDLKK